MKQNDVGEYLTLDMVAPDRASALDSADDIARQYFGPNLADVTRYVTRVELTESDFNGEAKGWRIQVWYKRDVCHVSIPPKTEVESLGRIFPVGV